MGLDMNPMARSMPGHEDEFRDLILRLSGRAENKAGLMGRLFGKKDDAGPFPKKIKAASSEHRLAGASIRRCLTRYACNRFSRTFLGQAKSCWRVYNGAAPICPTNA